MADLDQLIHQIREHEFSFKELQEIQKAVNSRIERHKQAVQQQVQEVYGDGAQITYPRSKGTWGL